LIAGLAVLALEVVGLLAPIDRVLLESRFRLQDRAADPSLILVELDARSIDEIGFWPIPRSVFANAVNEVMERGAQSVALDVDFSSRSVLSEDHALTEAVKRWPGKVILTTFGQRAGAQDKTSVVINRPIEPLSSLGQLALVNVFPERDGRVWEYPVGEWIGGQFHPSLAVILAGSGQFDFNRFLVDFSIDPETLQRVSIVDLVVGNHEIDFRDARVLIGATAIDAGDRINVPALGNISGVELQALAYSSIKQDRTIVATAAPITAIGLLVLIWIGQYLIRIDWWRATGLVLVLGAAMYGVSFALQSMAAVSLGIGGWLLALGIWLFLALMGRLEEQAAAIYRHRMEVEHRNALVRSVVETNFDGILITDFENNIEWLNPAGAKVLGIHGPSVIGRQLSHHLPLFYELATVSPESKVLREELEYVPPGGEKKTLEVVVGTSTLHIGRSRFERRDTDRIVRIFTFHDISARLRVEAAERAALEEAARTHRAKSEFLSNMSHELRTPLNAIIGFADVIAEARLGEIENTRYRDHAKMIRDSGEMLLQVINAILDVSRVEAGMLDLHDQTVDLSMVARWCADITEGWTDRGDRNLELDIAEGLPMVVCDQLLIKQVVINLLSNAHKFTKDGGHIIVKVGQSPEGNVFIEVADDGIGIPPEHLAKLFEAFYQVANSQTRDHGGSGLGLYLVRKYADMHDADLKVESKAGEGTRIRVVFPLERLRMKTQEAPGEKQSFLA
jgi:signal transduction histidine kinase/CHASE2 domain-containing sensor protein